MRLFSGRTRKVWNRGVDFRVCKISILHFKCPVNPPGNARKIFYFNLLYKTFNSLDITVTVTFRGYIQQFQSTIPTFLIFIWIFRKDCKDIFLIPLAWLRVKVSKVAGTTFFYSSRKGAIKSPISRLEVTSIDYFWSNEPSKINKRDLRC